jgi:GIY-YIG catalytic domain
MTKNNVHDLQSIVDKIAKLYYRIEELSKLINLDSLPSINLDNEGIFKALLPNAPHCVYFLTHAEHGLLYIGKAYNLKYRFKHHEHLQPAIDLGNARLSWLELPRELPAVLEDVLIVGRRPKWNKRIPWDSKRSQFERFRGFTK